MPLITQVIQEGEVIYSNYVWDDNHSTSREWFINLIGDYVTVKKNYWAAKFVILQIRWVTDCDRMATVSFAAIIYAAATKRIPSARLV